MSSGNHAENGVSLTLLAATYPLELLNDANRLAAESGRDPLADGRPIPSPKERTYARAAVFTAFNFLEALLIELVQNEVASGNHCACACQQINDALANGKARISQTIKKWPVMLGKPSVHDRADFREFKNLRRLRNNFTHPKFHPSSPNELTQDQLLQKANHQTALWAVAETRRMAKALYIAFGCAVPPEIAG